MVVAVSIAWEIKLLIIIKRGNDKVVEEMWRKKNTLWYEVFLLKLQADIADKEEIID